MLLRYGEKSSYNRMREGTSVETKRKITSFCKLGRAQSTRKGNNFIETILSIYLRFYLYVLKAIVLHCCIKNFEPVPSLLSYQKVGGGLVRAYKIWESHGKTELFLPQVTLVKCLPRIPTTKPLSQALNSDCNGL